MIYKRDSRYVCVFGAGQCGKELLHNTYVGGNIAYFIDNDKNKQGENIAGIPIISFNEYLQRTDKCAMVILSVDSDDMRQQLREHNIEWYEIRPGDRGYFNQSDVISKMDEKVLYKFDTDFWLKNSLVCTDYKNWYRTEYYSDENEKLIENMKKGDSEAVQNWLSALYKSVPEKLDDELFINRPGMRLIYI